MKLTNVKIALIALVLVVVGFYLAFAKSIPFTSDGYTVKGVFADAQSIRANSPVRVAGVDVGKVKSVEHLLDEDGEGLDAAVVTMTIKDEALPIREDATLQLRPRLFLEGNLFVDVQPGSPSAEELDSGSVIPLEQTSASVQLDQVLTSLQKPVREDLGLFLKEFGDGLDTYGGAEGLNELNRTSPSLRFSAEVNEAFLGTEPGDLAGTVRNLGDTVEALDRNEEQLKDLITNFRIVTGSFAAEDEALEQAIVELDPALREGRPALAKLNGALPSLRAFSREALPGVRAANPALDDANPFVKQLRALVAKKELRGLVKDLRPTIPQLASLAQTTRPFFEEARALSSCFNKVIIPWSNTDVPSTDGEDADVVYKNTAFGLVGIGGESRSGDANGEYIRVGAGGGTNTITTPPIAGANAPGGPDPTTAPTFGTLLSPLLGAQPLPVNNPDAGSFNPYIKTPFRPDQPCENQDPPNLASTVGAVPGQASTGADTATVPDELAPFVQEETEIRARMAEAQQMIEDGQTEEGLSQLAEATADLREFNKKTLPDYRNAIEGG